MLWLVVGYMFLFIFRPYEYWPILADLRIERLYMLGLMVLVFLSTRKRYIPHKINAMVLGFFAIMLVSAVTAYNPDAAFDVTFNYFKLLVFYFVVIMTIEDEEQLKLFITAYIGVMFLYVGKSAWEFFLNDRYEWRMGIRRMKGIDTTYGDPNAFAASIVYSFPFAWALIRYRLESVWQRRGLWAYGLLGLIGIVYTGSRSGMATVLLFFGLVWLGASRKGAGLVILVLILIASWNLMPEDLQGRFETLYDSSAGPSNAAESAQGRMEGFEQGIKLIGEYPLFGIGPGNFKFGWADGRGMNAHNLYGQVMGEFGVVGTVAFALLLLTIYLNSRSNIAKVKALELAAGNRSEADEPPADSLADRNLLLLRLLSVASIQIMPLMLFKGWADHNLYRYNWLWIGAITVLVSHFVAEREACREKV